MGTTVKAKLLENQKVDETTSRTFGLNNAIRVGLDVVWPEGASAGNVVLERAPDNTFTGQWQTILSRSCPGTPPPVGGQTTTDGQDCTDGGVGRIRIETAIAGGAGGAGIDAYYVVQYRD